MNSMFQNIYGTLGIGFGLAFGIISCVERSPLMLIMSGGVAILGLLIISVENN